MMFTRDSNVICKNELVMNLLTPWLFLFISLTPYNLFNADLFLFIL